MSVKSRSRTAGFAWLRGGLMALISRGVGPEARIACWLWVATAILGLGPATGAQAQVHLAQAGSEGGSLGGAIPPPPMVSRPRLKPKIIYERRPAPRIPRASGDAGISRFDGTWSVSSGGGCSAAGNGQVSIAHGRVMSPNGSGRVGPDGSVSTVSTAGGMTIVGQGRIVGNAASGSYRQSDGCVGPWSAVKL